MTHILSREDRERLATAKQMEHKIGGMAVRADIARRAVLQAKYGAPAPR